MEGGGEDPAAGVVERAAAGQRPPAVVLAGPAAVGVAGDQVAAADAEALGELGRGVDAAGGDRLRGEVGVEVGAQQAVDAPDRRRDAGPDRGAAQRRAGPGRRSRSPARDRAPGALGGAGRPLGQPGLGDRVGEAVDRAQDPLVVERASPGSAPGRRPASPPRRRCTRAAAGSCGSPCSGRGSRRRRRAARSPGRRGRARRLPSQPAIIVAAVGAGQRAWCSSPSGRPASASSSSSGSARRWSWLPGTRTIVAAGHRLAELLEERPRRLERRGERLFAQLEDVAEQDEAVGGP